MKRLRHKDGKAYGMVHGEGLVHIHISTPRHTCESVMLQPAAFNQYFFSTFA